MFSEQESSLNVPLLELQQQQQEADSQPNASEQQQQQQQDHTSQLLLQETVSADVAAGIQHQLNTQHQQQQKNVVLDLTPGGGDPPELEMTPSTLGETETTVPNADHRQDDHQQQQQLSHPRRRRLFCCFGSGADAGSDPSAGGFCCTKRWFSCCSSSSTALACARTTPRCVAILLPLLALVTHALFIHGQVAPMWRLILQVSDVDVWFNASSFTARTTFSTLGLDRDTHFTYPDIDQDVRTFTYSFAIQELWQANGLPGLFLPRLAAVLLVLFSGIWPHLKLIVLSLTWLFLGDGTPPRTATNNEDGDGPRPRNQRSIVFRRRLLHSLSTLGKWSLADVFVVCIMVGVLNLDWIIDPTRIKQGMVADLPLLLQLLQHKYSTNDMCSYMLKLDCAHPPTRFNSAKCASCREFVDTALNHPETSQATIKSIAEGVLESGGGEVRLRVQGMMGIYTFCGAVFLSILLSLLVDVYEAKAAAAAAAQTNRRLQQQRQGGRGRGRFRPLLQHQHSLELAVEEDEEQQTITNTTVTAVSSLGHSHSLASQRYGGGTANGNRNGYQLLDSEEEISMLLHSLDTNSIPEENGSRLSCCLQLFMTLFSIVAAGIVFAAIFGNTLDRKVTGAIPQIMHEILAIEWDRSFSLFSLGLETGAAGGWDALLMSTFMVFLLFGPACRAILLLVAWFIGPPLPSSYYSHGGGGGCCCSAQCYYLLLTAIDFLGAFCAWEVIVLAAALVSMLMPSITDTILNVPECAEIDTETGSCLVVALDPEMEPFYRIIVGGFLLLFVAQLSVYLLRPKAAHS